jgi:hypothetical protein
MKTSISDKEKDFSLHNFDNYNKTFDYEIDEVIEKYIFISYEFIQFILEKIKFKNNNYSKFIISRGYETVTNVFNIILYYTKNLDLTFYHCQKGYYYYIEFIEQISSEQHIFLQLNSRDATTYVYKKTIFEIQNTIKENVPTCPNNVKNKLDSVDLFMKIFKNIFDIFLEFIDFDNLSNNITIIDKFKSICQKIYLTYNKTNNTKLYNNIEILNSSFLNNEYCKYNANDTKETITNDYFEYIIQKMK